MASICVLLIHCEFVFRFVGLYVSLGHSGSLADQSA